MEEMKIWETKPLVGVLPLVDHKRESLWMLPGYMELIAANGGVPVMLPLTAERGALHQLAELCDGFLFTGGQDVAPALYGETNRACGELAPERDRLERGLLALALERDKPVLCICRGLQFLNVFLGGTLYQDLPDERPSPVAHVMQKPYSGDAHRNTVLPGTLLSRLLGEREIGVNSLHHQGIRTLAAALRPQAIAEDGLIEAAALPETRFVLGVQWHPEFRPDDPVSQTLSRAFLSACAEE